MFHLFFASLNVMLVFSSGIILYTGLYNSPETQYLLTLPMRPERIVLYKFQEAVFFSSWGFFLLASPIMIAYGIVAGAPWYYYLLLAAADHFVRLHPERHRRHLLPVHHSQAAATCGRSSWSARSLAVIAVVAPLDLANGQQSAIEAVRQRVVSGHAAPLSLHGAGMAAQHVADERPAGGGAARRPSVMADNVSDLPIVQSVLLSRAVDFQRAVFSRADGVGGEALVPRQLRRTSPAGATRRRQVARARLSDRILSVLLSPFPQPLQLLLMKDWRLLRRDPVQWSQFLIFFGLLGLYFLNVDRFNNPHSDIGYITWINMVSFLNLAVVGLILSTFTTRFIYPMISLEGHCFWILGLLPIDRDTILWSKFWFASLGSWVPCALLVLLSDLMLHVPMLVIVVHQLTCVLLCLGLSSIAVGFGAMMPNFRETSPSKIAAGFGGTLNLVLSALYIMVVVVLTALPCHFYLLAGKGPWGAAFVNPQYLKMWLVLGTGAAIVVGAVATIVPLRRGLRAFRKLEFV